MLGSGILKGLAVTAKNFIGSYHDPARMVTEQYPEERPKLPEAYRNFPFLVTENATDPMGTLRCVACQICEKECPPQCIYIEKSKDKKPDATGKMQIYPAVFAIDTSVCMSCQLCVEVCPFDAIKMDQVFEVATSERFNALLLNREQLAKPNTYFHSIRPAEAAEVDGASTWQQFVEITLPNEPEGAICATVLSSWKFNSPYSLAALVRS